MLPPFSDPMNTVLEKGRQNVSKNKSIEWVRGRTATPQGLVFVPPLIGGNFSQQLGALRWLIRRKYDLISFNYSGHGLSTGKFSLSATIDDTLRMLAHAQRISEDEHLPFFGVAACYAAIPLLYGAYCLSEPLKKIVLINAIVKLSPSAVLRSFQRYFRSMQPTPTKRLQSLLSALAHYVDFLFPGISKNKDAFGAKNPATENIV